MGGRIELDSVFCESFEDKALIMQLEMAQEKKQRQENAKNTMSGFKRAMDRLQDKLQAEQEQCEADEEALIKKCLNDIDQLNIQPLLQQEMRRAEYISRCDARLK